MNRFIIVVLVLISVLWAPAHAADSQRGTTEWPIEQELAHPFQRTALIKALLSPPDGASEAPVPQRRSGNRGPGLPVSVSTGVMKLTASQTASGEPPTVTRSFAGLGDNGQSIPPDTHGAAGPNHLMVTLNTQVRVQDRTGTALSTVTLNAFWAGFISSQAFDPKILYDHQTGRWIFTAMADARVASSALLIGVSATNDPTGAWFLYRVDADAQNTTWADYPSIGYNKDWIVVQVNMFNISNNQYRVGKIYVFNKSNLYVNGTGQHTVFLDSLGFSQAPAITYDDTLSTLFLVDEWIPDGDGTQVNRLRISTITGPVGAEHYTPKTDTVVTAEFWADEPPAVNFAPQSGTTQKITTNDARMQNLVYRNGSLWCAHTVFPLGGTPTRSLIQWWQLGSNGSVIQRGHIEDLGGAVFYAFPSIAVNRNNAVLVGYSSFSASQFPSAGYAFRNGNDLSGAMQSPVVFKAGEAKYFKTFGGSRNRWGDYSSSVVDPQDDTAFWTIQEYTAIPVGANDQWGTWWAQITPVLSQAQIAVAPSLLQLGVVSLADSARANVTIRNIGSALLSVDTLFTATAPFVVKPSFRVLNPLDSLVVDIGFVSPSRGIFADTLFIFSCDTTAHVFRLPLQAAAVRYGDSDEDAEVTVLDVVRLVGLIIGRTAPVAPASLAFLTLDLNNDTNLDVLDVIRVVHIILKVAPRVAFAPDGASADLSIGAAEVLSDGRFALPLKLHNSGGLAGLQFTLTYDPNSVIPDITSLPAEVKGLTLVTHASTGSLRMILISLDGRSLPSGEITIAGLVFTQRMIQEGTGSQFSLINAVAGDIFAFPIALNVHSNPTNALLIPTAFKLENARPNPFNPATTIAYEIASQTHVVIAVYNLLGQEVIRLTDSSVQPGRYVATWDARNASGSLVASGVYLYRMTTATGFSESHRLTVLR